MAFTLWQCATRSIRPISFAAITLLLLPWGSSLTRAQGNAQGALTSVATIVHFDRDARRPPGFPHGAQVVKLDTQGNAVDAKADYIAYFNGSYFLYGESYDCTYMFFPKPGFCGFRVYESPDLVTWTSRGRLVDRSSPAVRELCESGTGCWGPLVVYNPKTRKYVLWFYRAIGAQTKTPLVVMVGDSPTGPWSDPIVPTSTPTVFAMEVFIDRDGTGYVAWGSPGSGLHVQKLNDAYTDVVGEATTVTKPSGSVRDPQCSPPGGIAGPDFQNQTPAVLAAWKKCGLTESASLVREADRYYLLFSDPICAFCLGTGTSYFVADSPLGPWRGRGGSPSYDPAKPGKFDAFSISSDTCGGQPFHIAKLPTATGQGVNLFTAVLWTNSRNGGSANHYWEPLRFRNDEILPLTCGTVKVPLAKPTNVRQPTVGPINLAGIARGSTLTQTLEASTTGTIRSIDLTLYQKTNPTRSMGEEGVASEPLTVELVGARGRMSKTFAPAEVSWSPTRVRINGEISVKQGERLTLRLTSNTPQGRYATLFDDHNLYPHGALSGTGALAELVGSKSDLLFQIRGMGQNGTLLTFGNHLLGE